MKLLGSKLEDYIDVFENVISKSDCMFIRSEYTNDPLLAPAVIAGKIGEDSQVDYEARKVLDLNISDPYIVNKNEHRQRIEKLLLEYTKDVVYRYGIEISTQFTVEHASTLTYLKYKKGDFFKSHTDDSPKNRRVLSIIFALNDDFQGGEFEFFKEDKYILKQPMGSALVFPSNFLYPHEVREIKNGEKHSIIIWIT